MANNCCVSSANDDFAKELKSNEKAIPLPYHSSLDNTVSQLAGKNLPETFTRYEAFVDSALAERNIPLELKYLPYALSGMDSCFSKGDRSGYWAIPSLVAMHYGLHINENCDERQSVEASTIAALDYLNDLHSKYDDWWYSILAYANSPTSLSHALIHFGDKPQLWDFYDNKLMPDTYVIPDFIACAYLGSQNRLHFGSPATEPSIAMAVEPKTEQESTIGINIQDNEPAETVVADEPAEAKVDEPTIAKIDEPTIAKVDEPTVAKVDEPTETKTIAAAETPSSQPGQEAGTIRYRIKWGDTLWSIATKHHVTVNELKKWNNLKSDAIYEGNYLTIKKQ